MPSTTAKTILHQTISNFVCIDDQFIEPFCDVTKMKPSDVEFTGNLYTSFHDNHKNIKIIKYKAESTLEDVTPHFSNADIVILDWELGHHGPAITMSILAEAIQSEHVKYIFIYTNNKEETATAGLEEIRQTLLLSFLKFDDSIADRIDDLKDLIVSENILHEEDIEKYLLNIETHLYSFLYRKISDTTLNQELLAELKKINDSAEFKTVCPILKEFKTDLLSILLLNLRNMRLEGFPSFSIKFNVKNLDDDVFIANNKLVRIVSKKLEETSPSNLLSKIYDFISSEDDSFFSILSHEILYHFKQRFLSRAKLIAKIDDHILKEYVNYKDAPSTKLPLKELVDGIYNDIFMSVLKNQSLSYLSKSIEFFDSVPDKTEKESIEKLKFINSLISIDHTCHDLSFYRNNKTIEFGDIFRIKEVGSEDPNERYAMCVTPHCDCAHACSEQEFKFILSSEVHNSFANEETNFDSDFCTFLPLEDGSIKIVYWKPKVQKEDGFVKTTAVSISSSNDVTQIIKAHGLPKKEFELRFIAQQKENFTQRALNESVRHGIRVGVSYINIKPT